MNGRHGTMDTVHRISHRRWARAYEKPEMLEKGASMAISDLEQLYEQYIRPLPPDQRLRPMEMTARDLATGVQETVVPSGLHPLESESWTEDEIRRELDTALGRSAA